jgi:hypothetical protein
MAAHHIHVPAIHVPATQVPAPTAASDTVRAMSPLPGAGLRPWGAVGVVLGGRSTDGDWYQIFLWRFGVPLRIGGNGIEQTIRGCAWANWLLNHRGEYLVVVRREPDYPPSVMGTMWTSPTEVMWRFGPWDKSTAMRHKACLEQAIIKGRWEPPAKDQPDHSPDGKGRRSS